VISVFKKTDIGKKVLPLSRRGYDLKCVLKC